MIAGATAGSGNGGAPGSALHRTRPGWREALLFAAACALVLGTWRAQLPAAPQPAADSLRYLGYVVNLLDHGVFGVGGSASEAPAPGRANMPLYPAFVAALYLGDTAARGDLRCLLEPAAGCSTAVLERTVTAQFVVVALMLGSVWLAGWRLLGRAGAWVAAGAALLSGQPAPNAMLLLTENLTLLLCAVLTLVLLADDRRAARAAFAIGCCLGGLTLVRPEFFYLGLAGAVVFAAAGLVRGKRALAFRRCAAYGLAFALVVGPWAARNAMTFGSPALTATYGGQILAQRVSYNRMSARELGVAFVYWLPDFGDSLARRLFQPAAYERLGFGPGTYYAEGMPYHAEVSRRVGGDDRVARALIVDDVLGHPLKHALVTVALAWRAVFVGKLWGLLALAALTWISWRRPAQRRALWHAGAPGWFMLLFYAAVSVSIPRYAICLLPVFALALAAACLPQARPSAS
ncbi:MAG: hypothetical protein AB7Q81_09095 [Gammaproteobacteria bacterium]